MDAHVAGACACEPRPGAKLDLYCMLKTQILLVSHGIHEVTRCNAVSYSIIPLASCRVCLQNCSPASRQQEAYNQDRGR
jgi:hypothetical protein